MITPFLCLFLVLQLGPPLVQDPPKPVLIQSARVFDGIDVLDEIDVLLREGKIERMGRSIAAPQEAEIVDGTGKTLLPGLIDAHTHVFFPQHLERALIFGVCTELDMFMNQTMARFLRKGGVSADTAPRTDLFSAGTLVTAPGGHGTQFGLPIPTIEKPEDAESFVSARIAEGSDYIKIVYEHARPTISLETLKAVIAAARKKGKLAVVHISTQKEAREALEAGADGLVHVFDDVAPEEKWGEFVASKKAFVIPTLTVLESVNGLSGGRVLSEDRFLEPLLFDSEKQNLQNSFRSPEQARKERFSFALAAVRAMKKAGVPILAGSDAPNRGTIHGASIHRELELLVEAGLQPKEALSSATEVAAKSFGLKDRGRIAPGFKADLILVQGDPTVDIRTTRNILRIWKDGVPVSRPMR